MDWTIIDAQRQHVSDIEAINTKCYKYPIERRYLKECLSDEEYCMRVAVLNVQMPANPYVATSSLVIGYYFADISNLAGPIVRELAVDKNYRGMGVGSALLADVKSHCGGRPWVEVTRDSVIEWLNKRGYHFWAKPKNGVVKYMYRLNEKVESASIDRLLMEFGERKM